MRLAVTGFLGENRAAHPKLLSDQVGVTCTNQRPGRGDLRPWNAIGTALASVPVGRSTIYRMGRDVAADNTYWLSWSSIVHAVRGMVADDTTERTYYTGDSYPKVTDNTMALTSAPFPTASRKLGIPAPANPVSASAVPAVYPPQVADPVTGELTGPVASTTQEDRYYVYTYVSNWGEEGPPSPVSAALTCFDDETANLSGFSSPPTGYTHITKMRIYRTETGASGATNFFFMKEQTGFGGTTDDNGTLGEGIVSTFYFPPNADMTDLIGMWNGMMAGITGKAVRYCEPYLPYAWNPTYETLPPDASPVALAKWGQNLLVLTTGKPVLVTGGSPDALDEQPLEIAMGACVAKRSAVGVGHGAVWAGPDGLMYYGANGAKMLTAGIMTRDDWIAINPTSIIGGYFEGLYFAFYTQGGIKKAFFIDPANPQGMYFMTTGYSAMFFDELQDSLYVLNGTTIQKWNAGASLMTATFKSKVFKTPAPVNMSCGIVVADAYPVTFTLFADGVQTHQATIASRDPFWLPAGYLAEDWQVQVDTQNPVQAVVIADNLMDLAS